MTGGRNRKEQNWLGSATSIKQKPRRERGH